MDSLLSRHSHKMKEATLFILKQVLDEFGTTDKVMEVQSARVFLDQIRALMQDGEFRTFLLSPPLSPFCDRAVTQ